MADKNISFDTLVVHAGIGPDPQTGAINSPIYTAATYVQDAPGEHKGYDYARSVNPTRASLQEALALLEGGKEALVFSSGMASIDAVLNLLKAGDHVVAGDDLYGVTYRIFNRIAAHRGLSFDYVNLNSERNLRAAIRPNTKLIWFETPTNPLLHVYDIAMVGSVGRDLGIITAVDNTFMTPYFQQPLKHGIDIVMHSVTKYLNGHSDLVMGALVMNDASLMERLRFIRNTTGAVPSAFDCFIAHRGLRTLALRMERHNDNGIAVAQFLNDHPKVKQVLYPGLPQHPGHKLMTDQSTGFGGVMSFELHGGTEAAKTFLSSLKVFTLALSLGSVESLIEHPATMTHSLIPEDAREDLGIHADLMRLSVGIESKEDLIADLQQALDKI